MFGTLIVQLPSEYNGGDLVVTHGGQEKVFSFNGLKGCTNYHYAAFYADCQHELERITKGYRLCLVYNLVYTGAGSPPVPIENGLVVGQLVTAMNQWNDDAAQHKGPAMLSYILEHKYSAASLSFKALKNVDRAISDLLVSASQEANFDLYLAHVSRLESWSAECYRKKYTLIDLCDESLSASNLIAPPGKKSPSFVELPLYDESLVPRNRIKGGKPDEEERSEATGNEGASVERWYKYTAFILWPIKHRMKNVGCVKMTQELKCAVLECESPLTGKEEKEGLELAKQLVTADGHSSQSILLLLKCLSKLGQNDMIRQVLGDKICPFMGEKMFRVEAFTLCGSCMMWDAIQPSILHTVEQGKHFISCCNMIHELYNFSKGDDSKAQPKELFKELVYLFVSSLAAEKRYTAPSLDLGISILQVIQIFDDAGLVSRFLVVLASVSKSYYPHCSDITLFLSSQSFLNQILAVATRFGWDTLRAGLQAIYKRASSADITKYCEFLYKLCCQGDIVPQQKLLCRDILTMIVNILTSEQDMNPSVSSQPVRFDPSWDFMYDEFEERTMSNVSRSREFVSQFLKVLITLEYPVQATCSVVDAFLRQPFRYALGSVLVSALEDVSKWLKKEESRYIVPIVACVIAAVGNRTSSSGGADCWSQDVALVCKPWCDDCRSLQQFLRDPKKNQASFKMTQPRRTHLVKQLALFKCSTTHFTQKVGSPQTLVVNKVKPASDKSDQDMTQILARLHALSTPPVGSESAAGEPRPKRQKTIST